MIEDDEISEDDDDDDHDDVCCQTHTLISVHLFIISFYFHSFVSYRHTKKTH